MNLRRLRYFIAVAEELHFGRAAARLRISQPSLSQQIRVLERELGAELLVRTRRFVGLTQAGSRLLHEGAQLLRRVASTADEVGRIARGEQGQLTVGFVGPAMEGSLPSAIGLFRSRHPRVRLTFWHRGTNVQLRALRSGEQDVALIRPYRHDLSDLVTIVVDRQRYVLALPAAHRLGRKERVELRELSSESLILFPRATHPALYDRILGACADASYLPDVLHEASTKGMALALVASNLGVALVPEGSKEGFRPDVVFRSVVDTLPAVEIIAARSPTSMSLLAEPLLADLGEASRRSRREALRTHPVE